jgi:hypothetical protein
MPADLGQMPVAWQQLRIPGPPPALALSPAEQTAQTPETRFARRSIQRLELSGETAPDSGRSTPTEPTDQLALIDKASPHAQFDLMLTEVSPRSAGQSPKADAGAVMPITGQLLWQTAANFHRFVSYPEIRREFRLGAEPDATYGAGRMSMAEVATQSGWLQLALNCDPNTHDRESVQALKSFHLHLIYWQPSELRALNQVDRHWGQRDPYLGRQCLDPLSFIGPRLLDDILQALDPDLSALGAHRLPADASATCAGLRPMGCLIALPSWGLLATAAFEQLIRQLHRRLAAAASALLRAFTGAEQAPTPWQRHRLLPLRQMTQNLESIGLSAESRTDLLTLAQHLHDLPSPLAQHLKRASPARRMHQMTLNQPSYSLSLSPMDALGRSTLGADGPLLLSLQLKLFSGIGGAGLFSFPGIPSVRVLRAQGRYSDADWQRRADFQRRFADHNTSALMKPVYTEIDGQPKHPDQRSSQRSDQQHREPQSTGPMDAHRQGPLSTIRQATAEGRLRYGPVGQFQNAAGWTR